MKITKIRGIAMAAVISVAALLASPVAANAANTTYDFDCDSPSHASHLIWYAAPGDTVTLNLTNCNAFVTDPFGPNPVTTPVTTTWVGNPGDQGMLLGTTSQTMVAIGSINAEHTPAGTLLVAKDITIGAHPKELKVGPSSNPSDPTDDHLLAGKDECGVAISDSNKHIYSTLPIKITKTGTYTFRGTHASVLGSYYPGGTYHPLEDSFLAVYKNFDPKKPDVNVVGCNDDLNDQFTYDNDIFVEDLGNGATMEGHQPYFTAHMTPGYYTLVLMTWESISAAHWAAGVNGDADAFTAGPAATHFELWGPTGGLTTDFTKPTLAETGTAQNAIPMVLLALVAFMGSVALMRAPKHRK